MVQTTADKTVPGFAAWSEGLRRSANPRRRIMENFDLARLVNRTEAALTALTQTSH